MRSRCRRMRECSAARPAMRSTRLRGLIASGPEHLPHIQTPQTMLPRLRQRAKRSSTCNVIRARQGTLSRFLIDGGSRDVPHLWHYLGLGHLAEHRFTDAARPSAARRPRLRATFCQYRCPPGLPTGAVTSCLAMPHVFIGGHPPHLPATATGRTACRSCSVPDAKPGLQRGALLGMATGFCSSRRRPCGALRSRPDSRHVLKPCVGLPQVPGLRRACESQA